MQLKYYENRLLKRVLDHFLLIERIKESSYKRKIINRYFWRNYAGTEIDLIEIEDGKLSAFEFKWSKDSAKTPKSFKESYGVEVVTVNRDSYLEWLGVV